MDGVTRAARSDATIESPFAGPGEVRALYRALDWAETPLGPVERWPRNLRAAIELMLAMPQPACVCWGPDARVLYNDDFRLILGPGHPTSVARPMAEVWPGPADSVRSVVGDVFAGKPRQFVDQEFAMAGRGDGTVPAWFTGSWTPLRDDAGQIGGFFCVAVETTARVLAMRALRASEARQAFLLELGDALRPVSDPVTIQEVAAHVLGEHLGVSRVAYGEVADDDAHINVGHKYAAGGAPPITGRFRMTDVGTSVLSALHKGHPVVVPEVAASAVLSEEARAACAHLGIGSLIGVPVRDGGRLVAILTVQRARPHAWTDAEVALVEETAERTRAAVTLVRAEAALRENETRAHAAPRHAAPRPPALDGVELAAAIGTYVASWSARYAIAADVETSALERCAIGGDAASALSRVVREALTNVAKHAEASHVSVVAGCSNGEVRLIVSDDGRGFDVAAARARARAEHRRGLAEMQEYVARANGTAAVESGEGSGTTVYVRLPAAD